MPAPENSTQLPNPRKDIISNLPVLKGRALGLIQIQKSLNLSI